MTATKRNNGKFSVIDKSVMIRMLTTPAPEYDAKKEAKKARKLLREQGLKV